MTSLGPLTTTFTQPPLCRASFATDYKLWQAADVMGPLSTDDCFPSNYAMETDAYYSPGVCPSGYIEACKSSIMDGLDFVTTATCCPPGFTCRSYPPEIESSTYCCTSRILTFSGVIVKFSSGRTASATTSPFTLVEGESRVAHAFAVNIRYRSADFEPTMSSSPMVSISTQSISTQPISTQSISTQSISTQSISLSTASRSASPTSLSTASRSALPTSSLTSSERPTTVTSISATTSPITSTPPNPTVDHSSNESQNKLSTGALAGIGVGAGVAFIALLAALIILFRKHRRRRVQNAVEIDTRSPTDNMAVHRTDQNSGPAVVAELQGDEFPKSARQELDTTRTSTWKWEFDQ